MQQKSELRGGTGGRWNRVKSLLPHGLRARVTDLPDLPGTVPVSALKVPGNPSVLNTLGWSVTLVPNPAPYSLDVQVQAP